MDILKSLRQDISSLPPYAEGKKPSSGSGRRLRSYKLSSNENPLGSSPLAMKAIRKELKKGLHQYPDPKASGLKAAISLFWRSAGYPGIEAGSIVCGDSADEVLNMIASAFINEGDSVVISVNSFSIYRICSASKGASVIEIPRKDFSVDLDGFVSAVKTTPPAKLIMFSNPDNPTSTFHNIDEIESFLGKIPVETAVVLDEAYIHFAGIENSSVSLLDKFPNLIIVYTFSKVYGLAGLRVGYALMNSEIAKQVEKIRMPFNLGCLQLIGALAALGDKAFYQRTVRAIESGRDCLSRGLDRLGIRHLRPSGNFIFADLGPNSEEIISYIEENGITVRRLVSFGFTGNYVRISVGSVDANRRLLELLGVLL